MLVRQVAMATRVFMLQLSGGTCSFGTWAADWPRGDCCDSVVAGWAKLLSVTNDDQRSPQDSVGAGFLFFFSGAMATTG